MADMFDYLAWRGDLTLEEAPWNEIDHLILSELVYMNFTGIADNEEGITVKEAAKAYVALGRHRKKNNGDLYKEKFLLLITKMAESRRFADLKLMCYVQKLSPEINMQFAAIAMQIGKREMSVAFRGTDDTLLGWKEDFLMSFMEEIPSQKESVLYLKSLAETYAGFRFHLGGHSKGGNLSMYCVIHAGGRLQRRILNVYNYDGPGLAENTMQREEYQMISERIHTYVPPLSIVGMLLEHDDKYTVVNSTEKGMQQHDAFSWEVLGPHFVLAERRRESVAADEAIRKVFAGLSVEQKQLLTYALFDVLEANHNRTVTDLRGIGTKGIAEMIKVYDGLEKETRKLLQMVITNLVFEGAKEYRRKKQNGKLKKPEE